MVCLLVPALVPAQIDLHFTSVRHSRNLLKGQGSCADDDDEWRFGSYQVNYSQVRPLYYCREHVARVAYSPTLSHRRAWRREFDLLATPWRGDAIGSGPIYKTFVWTPFAPIMLKVFRIYLCLPSWY